MIDQRTKNRVLAAALCQSPRIGSTCFITSRLIGRTLYSVSLPGRNQALR